MSATKKTCVTGATQTKAAEYEFKMQHSMFLSMISFV